MADNARFDALVEYLESHEAELLNLNLPNLKQCLRTGVKSKTRAGDPERTKHYKFFCGAEHTFSTKQKELLSQVASRICVDETQQAFDKFMGFLRSRTEELSAVQAPSLLSFCSQHKMKSDKDMRFGYDFLTRKGSTLSEDQEAEIERFEIEYCKPDTEPGRLKQEAAKQRQFDKFISFLESRAQELAAARPSSLRSFCSQHKMKGDKDMRFGYDFLTRVGSKLTKQQEAKIRELEAKYCTADEDSSRLTLLSATEPSARQCAKFVEMCGRRIDDLKACGATSVEALFATNQRRDRDFRFGYDFVHRVLNGLPFDMQAQVRAAVGPALKEGGMPPLKADYASKLHASECVLGDSLPRPRMPKSLRQFYGNSADAETRIMTFFHRVHEVDSFLNGLEFQDCSYCHEGWFGSSLARAELPGKFESQTYKKTNFLRASVDKWLQPDRPICQNCLQEAKARAEQGLPKEPFRLTEANHADPGESLPETDALTFFEEELLSPIQHIVRIFTLHATGQCELRGHVGNLFQNGPPYVREIPAVVGDMKMLLIRRCPKDPNRKQRVPFLVSRVRLERALDRLCRPVEEGGSLAFAPGGLTPEGYAGFVNRSNLQQFSASEVGEEPEGMQVAVVEQALWERLEFGLFASWISVNLSLQLATLVRLLHEPADEQDAKVRVQQTWQNLHEALRVFVEGPPLNPDHGSSVPVDLDQGSSVPVDLDPASVEGPSVNPDHGSSVPVDLDQASSVPVDLDPASVEGPPENPDHGSSVPVDLDPVKLTVLHVEYLIGYLSHHSKNDNLEEVGACLHDELTAAQELATWEEPMSAEGLWSPEDVAGQHTEGEMKEELWDAVCDAYGSESQKATIRRHGAARLQGFPILDPPRVQSRNEMIREDQAHYITAGFPKLFPLGRADYWAHEPERREAGQPLPFWEWLKHLLLYADGRFQAHPRFYFFALNTALRNKALRARSYFVKRQVGLNTNVAYTNEELFHMGKSNFTKLVSAFEHSLAGSAQEKIQQRSDLEALVEQIEQNSWEEEGNELQAAVQRADAFRRGVVARAPHCDMTTLDRALDRARVALAEYFAGPSNATQEKDVCAPVGHTSATSSASAGLGEADGCEEAEPSGATPGKVSEVVCAPVGHTAATSSASAGLGEADVCEEAELLEVDACVAELESRTQRLSAGGEIPCHFSTLTTAIYHWQDLASVLQKYDNAVRQRRGGRSDPSEVPERSLSAARQLVLRYPGVVAWFTAYKIELFYKYVLQYEDGQGVFEWGAGGIMHLHSINFGSRMPRIDPESSKLELADAEQAAVAAEFAEVHEEYLTDWSLGKAEKWSFKGDRECGRAPRSPRFTCAHRFRIGRFGGHGCRCGASRVFSEAFCKWNCGGSGFGARCFWTARCGRR